ncbi:MAG TPA: 3-hydroxyacyl-CoA dehydrogenase family protein [Terrimesophilobacter sp.]|nr:3-hydroxyacyl-CoA dehydrogenase family protein [Terrimesophilobacter sp.]
MTDFAKVALLGFGTMGAGIAQVIAASGRPVKVLELNQQRVDSGLTSLKNFLAVGVERGKLTSDDSAGIAGRVSGVTELAEIADCTLVIEAVTERRDVKRQILSDVAAIVAADAVIVTNTSALSVTDLSTSVSESSRFAGLHFFNPAPLMKVIEIVRAIGTDESVIDRLVVFVESMGKDPVVVKDRPGFLVNSLLMPYLNDVIRELDAGLASAGDIDAAIRLGLGYKIGPLELLDMIGLDVHDHATTSAYEATLDAKFASPPLLQQMIAAGRLGAKNGRGFRVGEEG